MLKEKPAQVDILAGPVTYAEQGAWLYSWPRSLSLAVRLSSTAAVPVTQKQLAKHTPSSAKHALIILPRTFNVRWLLQDSLEAKQSLVDYQQAKAVHDAEVRQRYVLPEGPRRELRQALGRLCDKAFRVLEQDHSAVVAKDQRNLGILNSRYVIILPVW